MSTQNRFIPSHSSGKIPGSIVYGGNQPNVGNNFGPVFDNLLTKKQLAAKANFSPSQINKLMKKEGLPYYKIGRSVRYRESEITSWLQKRRRP